MNNGKTAGIQAAEKQGDTLKETEIFTYRSQKPFSAKEMGRISFSFFVFIIIVAALIPVAYVGWRDLYTGYLQASSPTITILESTKGIGLLPVSIKVKLEDRDSGLYEVVVRTRQRDSSKVLLRQKLSGQKEQELTIDFPGQDSALEPGVAQIIIRAFDQSLWKNKGEETIVLRVDYRKPHLKLMSTQHNVNHGGAQVAFYKAFDESLSVTGVKVGSHTFLGFPARGIDPKLDDENLFVALYAIDLENNPKETKVRIFAEDEAGNAHSEPFFNRIRPAQVRNIDQKLSEEYLRTNIQSLVQLNLKRLESIASEIGMDIVFKTKRGSQARMIEEFRLVNEFLRSVDNNEVMKRLGRPRFDRYFNEAFEPLSGQLRKRFADILSYKFNGDVVGKSLQRGYLYRFEKKRADVPVVMDGYVTFADNIGIYGKVVAVDHGLGLATLYGSLGEFVVSKGDKIEAGDVLGRLGQSGLYGDNELYFEARVHGVPVNPREWFDRSCIMLR